MDSLVHVRGLGLKTGARQRVAHVDLVVDAGSVIGLVGPNGAGKTTILRLLAGLLRPTDGAGLILGQDIRRPRCGLRDRPGYLPQSASVPPDLTVRELLRYRAMLHDIAGAESAVMSVMEEIGLAAFTKRRLRTLSGGWLRRAELAAAIITRPRLLLLDEPTTGLDQDARAAIWTMIAGLAGRGVGIVVNTHDLAEAERCDHLILLVDGRVAGSGSPKSLLDSAGAARLEDAWPRLIEASRV